MVDAYSVPGTDLVIELAKDLKANKNLVQPGFVDLVKTGASKERAPEDRDWYYTRMASILRRIYMDGPVGTERLRTYYGSRKNRGVKPHKFRKASGKIVRTCLQALEKEGFIKKAKTGRIVTPKGQSYLNKKSRELHKKLKANPKQRIISALKSGEDKMPTKAAESREEKGKGKRKEKGKKDESGGIEKKKK